MQMQLKLLTETLQGKSKNMKTYNINKNKKKGGWGFPQFAEQTKLSARFFWRKNFRFS